MAMSRWIAGLVGPLLAAVGFAMIVNRNHFPTFVAEMARDQGLIFLSGILSLLAGLAIVRVHNIWPRDWRVVVTVLGWLAVVGGLFRLWGPQHAAAIAQGLGQTPAMFATVGVIVLAVGAFLSYKAYGPE